MKIPPTPQQAPAFDSNDARYWHERDLEQEMRRVFEICHGCRMCVNYCGAFPDMFARVDRDIESGEAEGAELLGTTDFEAVTDLCWQCKLCYIKCPYTPDEKHEWQVDVPRLLTREKAQRTRRRGLSLEDRALGEPGLMGRMTAGPMAKMANLVTANRLVRKVGEKTARISAEFPLPPFATTTFPSWLKGHEPLPEAGTAGTVAIFATCQGDYNFPATAANAVRVLEKNGFSVVRPKQECCGIPNLDGGDLEAATAKARANVASLLEQIELGRKVVVPGPSCSYTIRKEYPQLLGTPEAKKVAENVFDLMEFLDQLRKAKTLNRKFLRTLGRVAYHAPCHLRAQKIGFPGVRVLSAVPDTDVELVQECSAVDGTWGMKAQHYEMGRKYAQKLVQGIEEARGSEPENALVVSDCPLAGLRMEKENKVSVCHPITALAEAYDIAVKIS